MDKISHTVDGRSPVNSPVDMVNMPLFIGFHSIHFRWLFWMGFLVAIQQLGQLQGGIFSKYLPFGMGGSARKMWFSIPFMGCCMYALQLSFNIQEMPEMPEFPNKTPRLKGFFSDVFIPKEPLGVCSPGFESLSNTHLFWLLSPLKKKKQKFNEQKIP